MKILLSSLLTFALLTTFGCSSEESTDPPVISVKDDDPEMAKAIDTARQGFDFFAANWEKQGVQYSLKFAVPTADGDREHIWFNPIKVGVDTILAECANNPQNVPDLKLGDQRYFDRSDLSDWMLIMDGLCYGGYTIRLLAARDPSFSVPYEFADF